MTVAWGVGVNKNVKSREVSDYTLSARCELQAGGPIQESVQNPEYPAICSRYSFVFGSMALFSSQEVPHPEMTMCSWHQILSQIFIDLQFKREKARHHYHRNDTDTDVITTTARPLQSFSLYLHGVENHLRHHRLNSNMENQLTGGCSNP